MSTERKAALGDMTEEELDGLTEEERAGLMEDDDDGEGDDAGVVDEALAALKDEPEDTSGTAEGAVEDAGPGKDPAQEPDVPTQDDEAVAHAPVPLIRRENVDGVNARLEEIKAEKATLSQEMDGGDMTAGEYLAKLDALNDEAETLRLTAFKADLAKEVAEQQTTEIWSRDVNDFLGAHPELKRNMLVLKSFDGAVREITKDEANRGLSNTRQLQKAYDYWRSEMGFDPASPATPAAKDPAPAERKTAPSLARVPAADMTGVDDGKYASLDRLMDSNPEAYQAALERMSEAELAAYEASQ